MMRVDRGLLRIAAALAVSVAAHAEGGDLPRLTGPVVDAAGIIDARSAAEITEICLGLDRAGIAQIAVATVPSLGERTLEEYAVDLFKSWGLGHSKQRSDGLLVLLVPGPPGKRLIRIEVGYGLEGILPDGKVGALMREHAFPWMKQDAYGAAAHDLVAALARELNAALAPAAPVMAQTKSARWHPRPELGLLILLAVIACGIVLQVRTPSRAWMTYWQLSVAMAALGMLTLIALLLTLGGAGLMLFAFWLFLNGTIWAAHTRVQCCPRRDGGWMRKTNTILKFAEMYEAGNGTTTITCTVPGCDFKVTTEWVTEPLARRRQASISFGGGSAWSDSGSSSSDSGSSSSSDSGSSSSSDSGGSYSGGGGESGGGGASGAV
jgi:uncharacterized protein